VVKAKAKNRSSARVKAKRVVLETEKDDFEAVVAAFATDSHVTPPGSGKGFGSRALKVKKKIFAMMSSKARFVVKLPNARAAELVASGRATYFDPGHGRPMKQWVVVSGGVRLWSPLAKEARDFVGG
jgi:hypothetical protein